MGLSSNRTTLAEMGETDNILTANQRRAILSDNENEGNGMWTKISALYGIEIT